MTSPYSPLVTDYPITPDELEAFAEGIPDEGQRRLGIAIARTLRQVAAAQSSADSAMAQARNARQMVLNRDPRLDTFEERVTALGTLLDQQAVIQRQLQDIAISYSQALPASVADRQALHTALDALTPRVDQLRTDVTANTAAITAEVARATAAEQANAKASSDEATRAKAAEAAEVTARQAGDAANAKTVTDEVAARQAADAAEAKTRGDADTAETSARTAADAALSTRIDTNTSGLAAETTARQQADATNAKAIADETTARQTAVTAEAKSRSDADTAEAGTRAAADTALGTRVDTVTSNLTAEVTARTNGDTGLSGRIDTVAANLATELTTRGSADTALGTRVDTVAANLATETTARTNADTALGARVDTTNTNLTAETSRAQTAEAAASKAAADEATRAKAAEGTLTTNLASETTARQNADTAESTARQTADGTLQTNISNEATTRANADTALGTRVDNEIARATAAEQAATRNALSYPPYATGFSYGPAGYPVSYSMTQNSLEFVPIYIPPGSPTIKAIQLEEISVAGTGRAVRFGIWADNGSGAPAALLIDAGTVNPAMTGLMKATLTTPLAATGTVWVGCASQGTTAGTPPQVRGIGGWNDGVRQSPLGQVGIGLVATALFSGAFSSNPAITVDNGSASPRLTLLF